MRLLPRKHVLQYDWLIHLFAASSLLFPVIFLTSGSSSNPWQLVLLQPLFLVQWYHGFWQGERHVAGHYIILNLLASWAMSMHWSGAVFFLFGQVHLLKLSRFFWASLALCMQAIWVVLLAWWWQLPAVFSAVFFLLIVFGGHANYLFFRHVNAQRDMLIAQEELEYLFRERERERIARDLHDILGHTLSTIALKAELAEKLIAANQIEVSRSELKDIAETARMSLADVRQAVTGYRSGNLRSEVALAQRSLASAGVQAQIPATLPNRISREVENVLSLIIREAITNVIRHSEASQCSIRLFNKLDRWHLIIADNGVGWGGEYGNGLTGMSERVAVLGGKLSMENQHPGTSLHAVINQLIQGGSDENN
jgi:two-component system, NarL family, sensor histidine kinase DesK